MMTDLTDLIAALEDANEHGEEIGQMESAVWLSIWWDNRHKIITALRARQAEKEMGDD